MLLYEYFRPQIVKHSLDMLEDYSLYYIIDRATESIDGTGSHMDLIQVSNKDLDTLTSLTFVRMSGDTPVFASTEMPPL